jgi:hypothetical protein
MLRLDIGGILRVNWERILKMKLGKPINDIIVDLRGFYVMVREGTWSAQLLSQHRRQSRDTF